MCNDVCLFYPWDNEERDSWSVWDAIFVFNYMLKYRTKLCCLGLYSLCVPCVCVWVYFTACVDRWVRKPPWYFWRWWKWFVMLADFIRTCQCRFPCKLVLSGGCSSVGRWFDPGCMPKNLGQDTNPCCSLIRLLEYECKCYIEKDFVRMRWIKWALWSYKCVCPYILFDWGREVFTHVRHMVGLRTESVW